MNFSVYALRNTHNSEEKIRQPVPAQLNTSVNGSSISPAQPTTRKFSLFLEYLIDKFVINFFAAFLWSAAKISSPPSPANAYSPKSPARFSPPDTLRHRHNYSLNGSGSR